MHDQEQVTGGEPEPGRVARVEDGADPGQLHEVVAPAHRAETVQVDAIAAPIGAPLPGCRSGMPATCVMPSRAATWWHWVTALDSIQLPSEANTVTEAVFP